jgi:hypothetical protein
MWPRADIQGSTCTCTKYFASVVSVTEVICWQFVSTGTFLTCFCSGIAASQTLKHVLVHMKCQHITLDNISRMCRNVFLRLSEIVFTSLNCILWNLTLYLLRPPLWSSCQTSRLQTQRSRVRFPALPDFQSSSGSGTGSTQTLWG